VFTGIVGEIGKIKSVSRRGVSAVRLGVSCDKVRHDVKLGDSIAVNGVCLTVVATDGFLSFDVVGNTLNTTNLKRLKAGDPVNLENALRMGDTISGHMVTGHIDGERAVRAAKMTEKGWELDIETRSGDEKNIVPKASVSIDGVSLTVGAVFAKMFRLYIIPHTLENTTLKLRRLGDVVNVEFDMMTKHIAGRSESMITMGMLREKGF
jgi:riboflavin synthase